MVNIDSLIEALSQALESQFFYNIFYEDKGGAEGIILKAFNKVYDKPLIIKVFDDVPSIKTFLSDAKKLINLNDEHIVDAFLAGQIEVDEEKCFYIIMEYIEGDTLRDIKPHIFHERFKSKSDRIELFIQTLQGIDKFRKVFIEHNDLHTGNIILNNDNIIKIFDLGFSKFDYSITSEKDLDLHAIKTELLEFFLKAEEVKMLKEKNDISELDFNEFKELIERESGIKTNINSITSNKVKWEANDIVSIEKDFKKQINENNLKFILSFYPKYIEQDLFSLDKEFKVYIDPILPLNANGDTNVFQTYNEYISQQNYLSLLDKNEFHGRSLFIHKDGLITFVFSTTTEINNAKYNNKYNLLPLYEVFDFTLGFLDFIMKIYQKEGFHEIFIKLEIENIQTFRHIEGPEIKFINAVYNPAVGKYNCDKFEPVIHQINLKDLDLPKNKIDILKKMFNPLLRCYGKDNSIKYQQFHKIITKES